MAGLKILYAMMATGNGHVAKGRVIIPELRKCGADVTCVFSGQHQKLFDMEVFEKDHPYKVFKGITFSCDKKGYISPTRTAFNSAARMPRILRDILSLDTKRFDRVVTDYEAVTAWAAVMDRRPAIGVGHQYAFYYDLPGMARKSSFSRLTRQATPVATSLGLHWQRFGETVLPPVIETPKSLPADPKKILIYMNFEEPDKVAELVQPFRDYRFHIYGAGVKQPGERGNVVFHTASRAGFQQDLADCAGAISNAGFEFPSELLQMGKKILVKPQDHQPEQFNNGYILQHLGYGDMMTKLDRSAIGRWLDKEESVRIDFPPVGASIAEWLTQDNQTPASDLSDKLWQQTIVTKIPAPR